MTDCFALCRERVTAEEAARLYGIPVSRGKALCPFHNDHRPSMSFHRGRYRCWSCGETGDAVDFTARLFGLSPLEAMRRLNADFGLRLPLDRPETPEERAAETGRQRLRETEALYEEWREGILNRLCDAIRTGNTAIRERTPEDWTPEETLAVRQLGRLEWYADTLEEGSMEEQMEVFRMREEADALCRRILNGTRTRSEAG